MNARLILFFLSVYLSSACASERSTIVDQASFAGHWPFAIKSAKVQCTDGDPTVVLGDISYKAYPFADEGDMDITYAYRPFDFNAAASSDISASDVRAKLNVHNADFRETARAFCGLK